MFRKTQDNFKLRVFRCAAYVHKNTETQGFKLAGYVEPGAYLISGRRLYCVFSLNSQPVLHSKHVSMDEKKDSYCRHDHKQSVEGRSSNDSSKNQHEKLKR